MPSNHTPGPWEIDSYDFCVYSKSSGGISHVIVADVRESGNSYPKPRSGEDEANLSLIAAAPDLLEVARIAAAMLGGDDTGPDDEDMRDVWEKVHAAIAKAEWRPE